MTAKLAYKAKKVKIVFFDVDDTLRDVKTGRVPESVKKAFKSLKEKGILTGIATGRGPYGLVPEIRELAPDYFVTLNGAYVLDKEFQEVAAEPLDKDLVAACVAWANAEGISYGFAGKDKPVVSERNAEVDAAIVPVYGELEVAPDFHQTQDVFSLWTFAEADKALVLPEILAEALRLVPWHKNSSDVLSTSMSKAIGVSKVLEKEGLKPEQVLFFGDGQNDLELFDAAGLAVAMGNSVPELKEKADYVTADVLDDGIWKALLVLGLVEKELHFPQLTLEQESLPTAIIQTNHGDLVLKLFPEQAPKTVANFIALAKDDYYDGVIFHRIIKDFMIQGGDPTGTGMGGSSIYGERFEDEFSEELYHIRGALSMANAGPNTNGSQFFIVQNNHLPYSKKEIARGGWPEPVAERYAAQGGTPHLDRRHTVFGQLSDEASYDVLDKIASVDTDQSDRPKEDVVILGIEVSDL